MYELVRGGGGGDMRFAFFRNFFCIFLGRSLSVMFKRKHSSGIVLLSVSCEEQWVLWAPEAPEIFFRHMAGGNFFV